MKIKIGGKGIGKTAWTIRQCVLHGGVIVCFSQLEAERVMVVARGMGYGDTDLQHPISITSLRGGAVQPRPRS